MSEGHNEQDAIDRLSADSTPPEDAPVTGGGKDDSTATPIPVRVMMTGEGQRIPDVGDDVVRAYEEQYYGADSETRRQRLAAERLVYEPPKHKDNIYATGTFTAVDLTEDERLWSALAHISALLTIGVGIVTGGWGALLMLFAPLAIHLAFRERSDFVAFQALQAFSLQVLATVGWAAVLVIGVLVFGAAIAISALASIVLVGIPFLVLFALLLVVFVLVMTLAAFALLVVMPIIGALTTYNGGDFRYPFIARWVDEQMSRGILSTQQ